jgi:hypothetical protein
VYRAKGQLAESTPDQVVATVAMEGDRILVSQDKDFKSQTFRQPRFARLSRLALVGPGPTLVAAVREHIHLIEAHGAHRQAHGGRMIIHVQVGQIRIRA